MRETDKTDLESAVYGVARLVAGYKDWKSVESLPNKRQWIPTLLDITSSQLADANQDLINADPKLQASLMRKLRGYQQLALIEKFCFDEVEW